MDSGIRTIKQHKFIGLLAQLVRALACHAKGHGFKSRTDRQLNAPVAQLVEHLIEDQGVGGSNPSGSTRFYSCVYGMPYVTLLNSQSERECTRRP